MSSTIDQYISQFLDYLKFQKHYSGHTVISYENDLRAFATYLQQQYETADTALVKPGMIRSWLASLKEADYTAKSINRKISSLKSLFKYLLRKELVVTSPMTGIVAPKIAKRLPQFVEQDQLQTLFQHVEFPDNWKGKTDRLLIQLLYETGMRQSELIGLKERNVDGYQSQIKVLGKGSKERLIPVQPALMKNMQGYIADKQGLGVAVNHDILLVKENGSPLTPSVVYQTVRKYLSLITTIEKRSPHILRHSFATHLSNSGADINAVKELLGHSSLAATQVYTHTNIEKLKEVYRKAHPKA
jgi:integrase/recombinase XerC